MREGGRDGGREGWRESVCGGWERKGGRGRGEETEKRHQLLCMVGREKLNVCTQFIIRFMGKPCTVHNNILT